MHILLLVFYTPVEEPLHSMAVDMNQWRDRKMTQRDIDLMKEVPKQLCFLKLDQSRLSQNEVQNLENMIQANKNYLGSI